MSRSGHEGLRVRGLSKSFGGVQVINGIDLDIGLDKRHLIIGPNGAGKTTFFNLLTGQISHPTEISSFSASRSQRCLCISARVAGWAARFKSPASFATLACGRICCWQLKPLV